jgi:hypothetical protein
MDLNDLENLPGTILEAFGFEKDVQVLYVTLADGQKMIFLGPAMTAADVEGVREVTFGEHVHAATLHYTNRRHKQLAVQ